MNQKRVESLVNRLGSMAFGYVNAQRTAATKATNKKLVERELWHLELLDCAIDYAVGGFRGEVYKGIMDEVNKITWKKS